ncbi:MAG TPA: methylated-DNA--[protein]-cysteine S-methyltransferase [Stellaceae bacterium]|jgi:methylated-DNA-[protein]-cysteine S-methyltransferase|nr:methylated-DNA--[protein]-cysteine S-methyltransferase [Stellaceae bacterium]
MFNHVFHLEHRETPIGRMMIVTDDQDRLRGADWDDYEDRLRLLLRRHYGANAIDWREATRPSAAARALEAYFGGDLRAIETVPTATNGTDFQRAVWAALRQIPVGSTLSYGALAARLGRATAMRAVGLANGANPIPVVVPCHRVIGADGSLTGFGGGLERKRWLLAHEGVAIGDVFESMPAGRPAHPSPALRPSRAERGNRA